ncbi:MAG: hypothetical protein H0T93_00210 [Chloroflexia bacterium]|nr:hypothetical protein [Chloroflexia bacterium]
MRSLTIWRFTALFLLLAAAFTGPATLSVSDPGFSPVAAQDDGGDDDGDDDAAEDRQQDKDERKEERAEDKEEKRQEKEERDAAQDDDESANLVEPTAGYGVDVACTVADDATRTECTFGGVAPEGGKRVSHVVIPEGAICANVLDGDFDRVDPDPNTNVAGYRATGNEPYALILEGQVTIEGATTYWIKAANEVFPATGPSLACPEPAASTAAETTTETTATTDAPLQATFDVNFEPTVAATLEATPEVATTGTITVSTYACTGVPADTSAYDWFGACDPGGEHRYVLAPVEGDTTDLHAAETSKTGEATFPDLPPGRYDLDDADGRWCHAESDAVNAEGQVQVEAGVETTVWLFYCQETPAS